MGIARALRRVKRQAKRGGLGALRSGLGEELRSGAIPAPLRGAARRIAAIIDPSRRSSHQPGSTATPVVERAPMETLRHAPPAQANKLGSDRGDAPVEPEAPVETDVVDPITVGATPVYDATPLEVEPVDATPADVAPVVVEPVAVEPVIAEPVAIEPAEAEALSETPVRAEGPKAVAPAAAEAASEQSAPKPKAKKKAGASVPPPAKEKLAPASGQATPATRSTTKAKRSGGQGGKTSKKK